MHQAASHSVNLNRKPQIPFQYIQASTIKISREKLQKLKKQANDAKQYFQVILSNNIKAQSSLEKLKRKENKIKYNFIKLYQTKKGKSDRQIWHQRGRNLSLLSNRSLHQKAKSKKLHSEFDKLLRQSQEDEKRNYLISKKTEEKKFFQQRLTQEKVRQLNLAKNSHDCLRNSKTSMIMRRKKTENVALEISKWNYKQKMAREAKLLKQYEILAQQVEQMSKQMGLNQDQLDMFSGQFLITGVSKDS